MGSKETIAEHAAYNHELRQRQTAELARGMTDFFRREDPAVLRRVSTTLMAAQDGFPLISTADMAATVLALVRYAEMDGGRPKNIHSESTWDPREAALVATLTRETASCLASVLRAKDPL